jgi:CHAT domain-containing protein/tetratricopeptide (TPR) repeat protein
MPTQSIPFPFSCDALCGIIRRSLLLLLTLSVLAGTLAAQSDQETKRTDAERLFSEGRQLYQEGSKDSLEQAIQKFEQARPLFHSVNDASMEAVTIQNIGAVYDNLGKKQKALAYYAQALPLVRTVGDRQGEAVALSNIGLVYSDLGEEQKALAYYAQALPLFRAIGDPRGEALTLSNIGLVYSDLGDKQKALDYYGQALPLNRTVGDRRGEAATLNNIGAVYYDLGEKQKALDYYGQALPLNRAVGDRGGEAVTFTNIGRVKGDLGEKQKALDYYAQALPLFRAVGDREGEAGTLSNIGLIYSDLGEKQRALDYFAQALALNRAVGDRRGEATTLTSIGAVYDDLGETQKALDYYAQALPLNRGVGDRQGEATTLSNTGLVYGDLGEKQKAVDYFAQALPFFRAVGDRQGEASTLSNIGLVYSDTVEKQKALDYFAQALPLFRAVADRQGEAVMLSNIGAVYNALGEKQKALDYFAQALPLNRAIGDRRGEGVTLNNMGWVYSDLSEKQKARDYFAQALPLLRAVGDRQGEALTLSNVAYNEREQGNLIGARAHIEAAIAIIESLRTRIINQDLRSSYFATVQGYYEFYIDLLMRLHKQHPFEGHDAEALQTSERARARGLLETLVEANADIRQGVDPILLELERSMQQRLNAKAKAQMKFLSGKHTDDQVQPIAIEIEALTTEFQQVEAEIRQKSPNYAALTQPQPLTLKEIQTQVLDKDTLLLQYSLDTDRSYLWAVTQDSITSYELPKRTEIEDTAREVYTLLTDVKKWSESSLNNRRGLSLNKPQPTASTISSSPEAIARLSQMVLAPAAAQLGKKRLVVVADGALQFIPFAALPVPNADNQSASSGQQTANAYRPLIAEHEIVSLPSTSTLAVLRNEVKDRQSAPKTFAVLADPVFERADPRLKKNGSQENTEGNQKPSSQAVTAIDGVATPRTGNRQRGLGLALVKSAVESGVKGADLEIPRLPGTRQEAEQILSLVPATSSKQAFDFTANRATATSAELSQYRYVHFATHGFLDSQHPELSGILLSMFDEQGEPQDGFLRAHEVFNLKLAAELVVLSACQTGLGKEVKGEGLVSLTRGFMYAGSPRVVVSLWSVSDVGTAELMTRFYRGVLKEGLRPAQALQAAQFSMFKEKGFASPFYWAAFTLQGEWR